MERNLWLAVAAILICPAFAGLAQETAAPLFSPQARSPALDLFPNVQLDRIQLPQTAATQDSVQTATAISNQDEHAKRNVQDQEFAYREFESIKVRLASLIKRYPHTRTGKAAEDMITRGGLRIAPPGRDDLNSLYPTGTFFGYVPITR